jgi:hypothetical protein
MKKFNPPIGKEQKKLIKAAMKFTKRDLAIMYVNTNWCFKFLLKQLEKKKL